MPATSRAFCCKCFASRGLTAALNHLIMEALREPVVRNRHPAALGAVDSREQVRYI